MTNRRLAVLFVALQLTALGILLHSANQTSLLRDNVGRILEEEMTITKTATWWCPSEMEWVTVTVSGDDAEKVCEEFRTVKASEQKDCPPGPPPSAPPGEAPERRGE